MLKHRWIHILILLLSVGIVYANSVSCGFVYDDKAMISAYDFIKDVSNIPQAFISPTSLYGNLNYYRPLQTISNITDYFLWGDMPAGFHITNILLHMAAVVLLYFFISLLFKNNVLAFLTSIIFAVHPVNATVVSYIAGRADSMVFIFMLLCFISYISSTCRDKGVFLYILSLFFFFTALLAKESAMIIPFIIILFDKYGRNFTELESPGKKRIYSPFFILLAGYLVFRIMKMSFIVEGAVPPFPLANRIMTVPYVLGQYLRLVVLPDDLHVGRMPWVADSFLDERVVISFIFVVVVFLLAYFTRKKEKAIWFGVLWFIIMIFPSLNIITPLFYTFAENWLYIPSIGLYLAISALFIRLYRKVSGPNASIVKYFLILIPLLYVLSMGAIAVRYNLTWKDEITLGMNTLRFNPNEFKVWNNVGVVYLGKGDLDKAEEAFRRCLEIKPDTGMAYFNLYRVYMARGQRMEAIKYLSKARELDPRRVGILVQKMGIKD